jgi:hypothetical protein
MDNKKFEQLIDLIINENEEQARELFHDIVVEKSREIYESIMDEEMMGEEGMAGSQVGGLLDEINAEEAGGMTEEEEDDEEGPFDDSEEVIDIDSDDMDHEGGGEIEDSVIRIEDKLDQLMAEFEQIMGGGDDDMEPDADNMGGMSDDDADNMDDEMDEEMMEAEDDLEEEDVMEAVQLKQVPGLYGSKIGGDNGAYTKSPSLHDPKIKAAGVNPVKFSGQSETVPTSPKGPSNYGSKGETTVKGAGSFKNSPGQDAGKSSFKEKVPGGFGHKTPQGKEVGAGGSVSQNDKSVLESRRTAAKKRI